MFSNPYSVAYNPKDGSCYVADCSNNRIRKISPQGVFPTHTSPTSFQSNILPLLAKVRSQRLLAVVQLGGSMACELKRSSIIHQVLFLIITREIFMSLILITTEYVRFLPKVTWCSRTHERARMHIPSPPHTPHLSDYART